MQRDSLDDPTPHSHCVFCGKAVPGGDGSEPWHDLCVENADVGVGLEGGPLSKDDY